MSDTKLQVTAREIRYVVEPLLLPTGQYGAHVEVFRRGPRGGAKRYEQVGPRVIAGSPEVAFTDFTYALRHGAMPEVHLVEKK